MEFGRWVSECRVILLLFPGSSVPVSSVRSSHMTARHAEERKNKGCIIEDWDDEQGVMKSPAYHLV